MDDERKKWLIFAVALTIVAILALWGLTVVAEKNTPEAQKIWWQNQ